LQEEITQLSGIVSSLLKAVRVLGSDFAFLELLGKHRIRIVPSNRVFFHLVLRGTPVLMDEHSGRQIDMRVGDYMFVLHDRPHSIGLRPVRPGELVSYFETPHDNDVPSSFVFGRGPGSTKMLSGCLSLERPVTASLLKILPAFLFVNGQSRGIVHETMYVYEARQLFHTAEAPGGNQFLSRLAELLLVEAIRICTSHITLRPDTALDMRSTTQIIDVLQIMMNEMQRKWSVSALAQRANMSRSSFAAAFNRAVGQPPLHYLSEVRLHRAAELLKSEHCSLKEVAYRVGYDSEIGLGRAFKKFFGVTPGQYRHVSPIARENP
jgi:AraC-like DNA-binding protein